MTVTKISKKRVGRPKKLVAKKVTKSKEVILETFLKAIREAYPAGTLSPSLILAWLSDKKCFYASIRTYEYSSGQVRMRAVGSSPEKAIEHLMKMFKASQVKEEKVALDSFLNLNI